MKMKKKDGIQKVPKLTQAGLIDSFLQAHQHYSPILVSEHSPYTIHILYKNEVLQTFEYLVVLTDIVYRCVRN